MQIFAPAFGEGRWRHGSGPAREPHAGSGGETYRVTAIVTITARKPGGPSKYRCFHYADRRA